ncbi:unnamed protein product [Protopolystoma xenopodis]|uniref:Uncharacterized protein n=1 Tax=Protopolystoma xenopodis TaxID=117903 RepID=A0A3S5BRY9_9PLAT|nr:unnamed protein product [Protopolystoma xenopodis]
MWCWPGRGYASGGLAGRRHEAGPACSEQRRWRFSDVTPSSREDWQISEVSQTLGPAFYSRHYGPGRF